MVRYLHRSLVAWRGFVASLSTCTFCQSPQLPGEGTDEAESALLTGFRAPSGPFCRSRLLRGRIHEKSHPIRGGSSRCPPHWAPDRVRKREKVLCAPKGKFILPSIRRCATRQPGNAIWVQRKSSCSRTGAATGLQRKLATPIQNRPTTTKRRSKVSISS